MKTMNPELHNIIKEIREDDGKGETNTNIMKKWNSVIGGTSY